MTRPLYRPELCWTSLAVDDADQVINVLASALHQNGLVRATFEAAVREREASSPTGLPLAGRKVAIPHADPEHVIAPAVAACTLSRPVRFGEMGNPESALSVDVVLMLALPDHESAQRELVRLVESCQEPDFVDRLHGAPDSRALYDLLANTEQLP
jgi:PTS system galactitol-specific IIA component